MKKHQAKSFFLQFFTHAAPFFVIFYISCNVFNILDERMDNNLINITHANRLSQFAYRYLSMSLSDITHH